MSPGLITYDAYVVALRSVAPDTDPARVAAMLDGEASAELHRLVTLDARGQRYLTEGRVIVTAACSARTDQCAHLTALRLATAPDLAECS